MTNTAPTRSAGPIPDTVATVIGGVGQLVVGYFTLAAIGLIGMPVWGIVLLAGAWLAASAALVFLARRRPLLTLAVPVANAVMLWGVVAAGGAWLGWSA
jgi:hypothetical protein